MQRCRPLLEKGMGHTLPPELEGMVRDYLEPWTTQLARDIEELGPMEP